MATARPRVVRLGWRDVLPALVLLVIGLGGTGRAAQQQAHWLNPPDAVAYGYVVVAALALALRRRTPRLTLVVVGLAISGYLLQRFAFGPILLTGLVAAWWVGAARPWRDAVAWVGGFVVVTSAAASAAFVLGHGPGWVAHLAWTTAWAGAIAGVAAVGGALQVRRRSEEGVRAEQARRVVSEERLQMAQDMHDGVGHGLAVIAMHAGVALHVLDREPERARELLASIQATSREALDVLRADLDRWRSPEDSAARRPGPGLEDLPRLLTRMRAGGLTLSERITPCPDIPEEVGAAAYRIVQESLTNVLRHAGGAPAQVRITCAGDSLDVEVRDDGVLAPGTAASSGSGIAGMRARAEAVGGRLTAGPGAEHGFVVRAVLPLGVRSGVGPAQGAP